jgi:hypothetical protein
MRKLLASLLVLPFLLGANVPVAVPGERVDDTVSTLAQPSLAGHLSAAWSAAPPALPDAGPADSWRTATRTHRAHADPLASRSRTTVDRTHIATVRRARLSFGHVLARAHANVPATFGNPPPTSPT